MTKGRYRVLLVCSHPVQYAAPHFRQMARHPKLDILVAYLSLQGAEKGLDPGFGVEVKWDVPLLDGYPWVRVPNRSLRPSVEHFCGLINPGLWKMVRRGEFDAVVAYTGYAYASSWIALLSAKVHGIPMIFGTDATAIQTRIGGRWKVAVKKYLLPKVYGLASVVIVGSTAGRKYLESLGIPEERVVVTPYSVDNDWWRAKAALVDREAVRCGWQIPGEAPVILFCAKLQPWKRPQDVLRAFAKANVGGAFLVFAGEGPLRKDLEAEAAALGVAERVHFLGFVNQSGLPSVYRASDLLVLPSKYDAFGVVVNEAMLCGCAIAVSDRVGAGYDLVRPGVNGFVFPCGNADALADILREILPARQRLHEMGEAARARMETWSYRENIEALVEAFEKAQALKRGHSAAETWNDSAVER
jgi:glycosyltransferase involved in cell wall biosynthesis